MYMNITCQNLDISFKGTFVCFSQINIESLR